jgi:alginate O-acetyltransferase complex protein AlgI
MLFTTLTFALLFLPIALSGFYLLGQRWHVAAAGWLFCGSLFFYGWWMPEFTLLLLASIIVNFRIGLRLADLSDSGAASGSTPRGWLIFGVVTNLALLAYFKYANFFVQNLEWLLGRELAWIRVVLPIGISFYTFTQIAFLVDAFRGKVGERRFVHYGLFVTYFPHLIAGPVLHHAQMMPQFANARTYRLDTSNFAVGLTIFAIGLMKKIVLADGIAPFADAIFGASEKGISPSTAEAWLGAVSYSLQLYFDFSGYSDMAIGLSLMFNIRLPINFNSPYRATNISDFWRRWHISLSTFLRDYLYIALGGNRHGAARRYANLLATMVLGGLWHGASWSFVIWGFLHGLYLLLNHAFRALFSERTATWIRGSLVCAVAGWFLTQIAVVVAWVFFRAESLGGASLILAAMAGHGSAGTDAADKLDPVECRFEHWRSAGLVLGPHWLCLASF